MARAGLEGQTRRVLARQEARAQPAAWQAAGWPRQDRKPGGGAGRARSLSLGSTGKARSLSLGGDGRARSLGGLGTAFWPAECSGANSVGSQTGVGSGADSASFRTGAGSGADSAGSRTARLHLFNTYNKKTDI